MGNQALNSSQCAMCSTFGVSSKEAGDNEEVKLLVERARELRKEGDLKEAMSLCENANKILDTEQAHYEMGLCYLQEKDEEGAIREFSLAPETALAVFQVAKLSHRKYFKGSSQAYLYKALTAYPKAEKLCVSFISSSDLSKTSHLKNADIFMEVRLLHSWAKLEEMGIGVSLESIKTFKDRLSALVSATERIYRDAGLESATNSVSPLAINVTVAHAYVMRLVGLVEESAEKAWLLFLKATKVVKAALVCFPADGTNSLQRALFELAGSCFELAHWAQLKASGVNNTGNLERAHNAYLKALDARRATARTAYVSGNLARVQVALGKRVEAQRNAKRALQVLQSDKLQPAAAAVEEGFRAAMERLVKEGLGKGAPPAAVGPPVDGVDAHGAGPAPVQWGMGAAAYKADAHPFKLVGRASAGEGGRAPSPTPWRTGSKPSLKPRQKPDVERQGSTRGDLMLMLGGSTSGSFVGDIPGRSSYSFDNRGSPPEMVQS